MAIEISPLIASEESLAALTEIIIEAVAHGGSVSFMHPLSPETAQNFWQTWLAAADRGERIVLGAFVDHRLAGTVTLLLDFPPNQPHRAEIAKLMTRVEYRGQGIANSLMIEAEGLARAHARTLLVLDTATIGGASELYEKRGFTFAGEIPDYALKPHGGLTGTKIYWKRLS